LAVLTWKLDQSWGRRKNEEHSLRSSEYPIGVEYDVL